MSGWCESLGVEDQWHDVCADRIRRGLITSCPCPEHANDESRYQVAAHPVNTSGTIGVAKGGPVSAGTDRGLRPVPAKES